MSYRYYLVDSNIYIPGENLAGAGVASVARAVEDGFEVDGDTDLDRVLGWYGFGGAFVSERGLEIKFCCPEEADGDPERLLLALAPYAADGTRIVWLGENLDVWRGGFEGGEYVTEDADLTRIP